MLSAQAVMRVSSAGRRHGIEARACGPTPDGDLSDLLGRTDASDDVLALGVDENSP
jgi:hypothetical protein